METLLTTESPGKVIGLLGAAMCSLVFLLAVTLSDASFSGQQQVLPDPFGPQQVMAVLDQASNSYSKLADAYFINPLMNSYSSMYQSAQSAVAFMRESDVDVRIVAMAGLSDLVWQEPTPMAHPSHLAPGQVAGAFTMHQAP
ncbi:MAG: hypothetical protein KGJ93_00100 [Patescibacteria group bacterium]|nr:hypothetical protein [Patescibacteria group bacterium]